MPYCTQADISPARLTAAQLIQLTDDAKTGAVNAAVVTTCIAAASGLIENYCRERYQVPLQQTAELTEMCVSIAVYKLYNRRPGKMTETVQQSYKDVIVLLKDIAAKKASLDQPTGGVEQTPSANSVSRKRDTVFTNRKLEGYI